MKTTHPLLVCVRTDAERAALETALRSSDAFVLRHTQIVLARAYGKKASLIAQRGGFSGQGCAT